MKVVEMRYLAYYGDYMTEQCERYREEIWEKDIAASEYFTGRNERAKDSTFLLTGLF